MSSARGGLATHGIISVIATFFQYAGGYWRRGAGWRAIGLTLLLMLALLGRLAVDLGVNSWNRWFFDSLQARDTAALGRSVWIFLGLVVGVAAVGAAIVYLRETLQVGWRAWLTGRLLNDWLTGDSDQQHHLHHELEHAEYRISDDVRMATEPMVDFGIGFFSSTITGLSFLGVLWQVGGNVEAFGMTIPAYFVLTALTYGAITNLLVPVVGRHLTPVSALRNESEARFRSALIRSREAVESSANDLDTRKQLRGGLIQSYQGVFVTWTELVRQHVRLTWLTTSNSALTPVIPLLLGAPGYLSGQLTIGQIVQLALAFTQVQIALGWMVDNYMRVAEWRASAIRIVTMTDITGAGEAEHEGAVEAEPANVQPARETP